MDIIKRQIERHRGSRNYLWIFAVAVKDFLWKLEESYRNSKKRKLINKTLNRLFLPSSLDNNYGLSLWGFLFFRKMLDQNGRFTISPSIKKIKIDIGTSHNAPNSMHWLKHDDSCAVFGFEPHPASFERLSQKRGKELLEKRLFLFNVAVDNSEPKLKKFFMALDDPGTSSFYRPKTFRIESEILVPVIKLSDFLEMLPWNRIAIIDHLKVDTQGNDLEVLKSAGSFLSEKVVYVTAEHTTHGLYEHSHTKTELDEFMTARGFVEIPEQREYENATYRNEKYKKEASSIDFKLPESVYV